ncbi:hypothetical protein [Amycolatopsis sp. NBC_01480]|uniref:hypothetical protein n=1 Tax=Amycolatopsis sp. NBC_01480 TaxID=2903562 RepID=UPI002E2BDEE7|nr:hypothetical protein [Amycolatopsis sp. NBC_01480]
MATVPRKTPARRTTTRKTSPAAKPQAAPEEESSVLRLDRQEAIDAIAEIVADREPLFSIGDNTYTIPKKAPAAWAMKATTMAARGQELQAMEFVLRKMLGEDGYAALSECETLTTADFETIRDLIVKRVYPQGPKAS